MASLSSFSSRQNVCERFAGMIRRVSFIRRSASLTREAFFTHWTGRHAEIVRQLPGLRGLRFSMVDRCTPEAADWDGVGETWFDTITDADRAFATEPFAALLTEDRKIFIGDAHSCYVEDAAAAMFDDAGQSAQ
jgi:uncharacterized protein (TIGR02118 family)